MDEVKYDKDERTHIATITFNRPEKLNALTLEMYEYIAASVRDADRDDAIKVILFRGEGKSFSTGQDLSQVGFMYGFGDGKSSHTRPSQRRRLTIDKEWSEHLSVVANSSKVTVAAIQGHCLGSAFEMFMTCDLAVVTEDAQMGHPGRRLVSMGSSFNSYLWFWRLGPGLAKEMAITGNVISGRRAYELGVVQRCVPADRLEAEVQELVENVAKLPADGIVMGKAAFGIAAEVAGLGTGYSYGYIMHTLATNIQFEPDEENFFKRRRDEGARDAFHARDARFAPLATDPVAEDDPEL
jgi:enoyl-CoA hydratase